MNTSIFKKYFAEQYVENFANGFVKMCGQNTVSDFFNYHSEKKLLQLFRDIFPPPSMYEMWNAWTNKGRPAES